MTTPLNVVLVHPEIPHNTGAIGRLCVGLDCSLHLIKPLGFHLSDRYVQRAGLDYWQFLRLSVHDSWEDFLRSVGESRLFFLSTHGDRSLYECEFQANDTLVFGSEGSGLPGSYYDRYRERLFKIPMPGAHARSINLANSVSIAVYEAYRQLLKGGYTNE